MFEYIRTFWSEDFVDRKFPWCDYTTDQAAGATRYMAILVAPAMQGCIIRVLRQVVAAGAT